MAFLLFFSGMILGAISWHIGMLIADNIRRKAGCYRRCQNCGALIHRIPTDAQEHGAHGGVDARN